MIKKTACIFPGSFNPFHDGHFYVLEKALKKYFKKVYIVISHNEEKPWHDLNLAKKQIIDFLKNRNIDKSRIIIITNEYLTTNIMLEHNIRWIVRGYRNIADLAYEKQLYLKYLSYDSRIKYKLIKSTKNLQFTESKRIIIKNKL